MEALTPLSSATPTPSRELACRLVSLAAAFSISRHATQLGGSDYQQERGRDILKRVQKKAVKIILYDCIPVPAI